MLRVNLTPEYYSILLTMTDGRGAGWLKYVVQPMLSRYEFVNMRSFNVTLFKSVLRYTKQRDANSEDLYIPCAVPLV
jgi:hypothetical protein